MARQYSELLAIMALVFAGIGCIIGASKGISEFYTFSIFAVVSALVAISAAILANVPVPERPAKKAIRETIEDLRT